MKPFGRRFPLFILSGLVLLLAAGLTRADGPNQAGLVVVHGDGAVETVCVSFTESQISGLDLLERSGLDLNYEAGGGMGGAICRIDGEGCTYPQDDCFCQCQSGGAECTYWSYWLLDGGSWQYASLGAANRTLSGGEVDGWVWGPGSDPPPQVGFTEICQPDPPTPTPSPTGTPTPTPTRTPAPTPVIEFFTADRQVITAGESVTLRWNLSGAKAAYLRYSGTEEGVVAPGSKTVSPAETTVYTLAAVGEDGGQTVVELTITVNPVTVTPVPTATPVPADPPTATGTVPAGEVVQATPTLPPTPVVSFSAASTTLPAGACTTLRWSVKGADAVYLDDAAVAPDGAREACPEQSRSYRLRVRYAGGEQTAELALQVVEPPAVAGVSTASVPPPTATPVPAAAVVPASPTPRPAGPARPIAVTPDSPSRLARLGLWGVLAGGWCLIMLAAVAGWGVLWWLNRRRG